MTLKLVSGGVPATVRAVAADLAGGCHMFVTLISPSACMWSGLLCNATYITFSYGEISAEGRNFFGFDV